MLPEKFFVRSRACVVRTGCAHKAAERCAQSCAQALCAVVRMRKNVVRRVVRKALCAQGLDEQINAQHKSVVRFEVHNSDQFCAQGFLRWHKQKMLCRFLFG